MLLSIALIMLIGMASGYICHRLKLPGLLGMIITGIILGPYVLDLIDPSILNISADLRKIALIIILTRAGLTLDINDLKRVGRPAILMCFVPATFELAGMLLLAPRILGISLLEAAIMGAVVAAVSPAVVVPKMIKLIDEGYGTKKSIPQLILAGASVDDVYVIVLFSTFTGLAKGDRVSAMSFINIPVSVVGNSSRNCVRMASCRILRESSCTRHYQGYYSAQYIIYSCVCRKCPEYSDYILGTDSCYVHGNCAFKIPQ